MTPAAWAFLGWAIFASLIALALLGALFGDRTKTREEHAVALKEAEERRCEAEERERQSQKLDSV